MLKRLIRVVKILALVYTVLLGVTYAIQERLLFFPDKLEAEYQFHFDGKFEEINLHTDDGHTLNGLHFYHPNPKGAVLFFHGNSASLKLWGGFAQDFAALGYDTGTILETALKNVSDLSSKDAIKEAIKKFDGTLVTGSLKFDAERNPEKKVTFIEVKDGKLTLKEKF